ncbi:MAG TPA: CHAD domain-containing protein, partial [Terriglobales bacterium]
MAVHKLRTTIRRGETYLAGCSAPGLPKILKGLKRIRKRAGSVRDIDVQLELLKSLHRPSDSDVITVHRLLIRQREKQARKLTKAISSTLEQDLPAKLKQLVVDHPLKMQPSALMVGNLAEQFFTELSKEPLDAANLHAFRLVSKHLRYNAEMMPASELRDNFISSLKEVQDAIGLWHDYLNLEATAREALGEGRYTLMQRHLHAQVHVNFLEALRTVSRSEIAIRAQF